MAKVGMVAENHLVNPMRLSLTKGNLGGRLVICGRGNNRVRPSADLASLLRRVFWIDESKYYISYVTLCRFQSTSFLKLIAR